MTNVEKYNAIYADIFGAVAGLDLKNYSKETVADWDSVHQLGIISGMEEAFDLMLDPEDIMACTSYCAGVEILKKNGIEL